MPNITRIIDSRTVNRRVLCRIKNIQPSLQVSCTNHFLGMILHNVTCINIEMNKAIVGANQFNNRDKINMKTRDVKDIMKS